MGSEDLRSRVERVRGEVGRAASRSGRDPRSIMIVAVSKTVGREAVDRAYALGLRHFGENRVQDARDKFAEPMPAGTVLHMIGQLQTNKAGVAARLFDLIESVDRPSLVDELERQGAKLDRVLSVLLEVNVAGEERKAGCPPAGVQQLVARIERCDHVR